MLLDLHTLMHALSILAIIQRKHHLQIGRSRMLSLTLASCSIGLWSTDGIPIRNNVIYNTYESALIITGKDNLVQNNLISTIYWSGTAQPDSAPFNINYDSAILAKDAITLIMRV